LNGSTFAAEARMRSSTIGTNGFSSLQLAWRRQAWPIWNRKNSSKISRRCAGDRNAFSTSTDASFGGKWDSSSAGSRGISCSRVRSSSGNRIGMSGWQLIECLPNEAPLHVGCDGPGLLIERHDTTRLHTRQIV
jgi:hypothetical protein